MAGSTYKNDQEKFSVTCREALPRIAEDLKGLLTDSGVVVVDNVEAGTYIKVEIAPVDSLNGTFDLLIMAGKRGGRVQTNLGLMKVDEVYLTWDSPGLVTFYIPRIDRFTVVNINARAEVTIMDSLDSRRDETETAAEKRGVRRRFYRLEV